MTYQSRYSYVTLHIFQEGKENPAFVGDEGLTRVDLGKSRNGNETYSFAYGAEADRKSQPTEPTEQMVQCHSFTLLTYIIFKQLINVENFYLRRP